MTTIQDKKATCICCKVEFPATKDYFYTSCGKLKLSNCKECKKAKNREASKKRNSKLYWEKYKDNVNANRREKYRMKKALLVSKDI